MLGSAFRALNVFRLVRAGRWSAVLRVLALPILFGVVRRIMRKR